MFRHNPAQLTVVPLIETPGVDDGPRMRVRVRDMSKPRFVDQHRRIEPARVTPSSARGRDLLKQGLIRESSPLLQRPGSLSCTCQKRTTEVDTAEWQGDIVRLHKRQPPREEDIRSFYALGSPKFDHTWRILQPYEL